MDKISPEQSAIFDIIDHDEKVRIAMDKILVSKGLGHSIVNDKDIFNSIKKSLVESGALKNEPDLFNNPLKIITATKCFMIVLNNEYEGYAPTPEISCCGSNAQIKWKSELNGRMVFLIVNVNVSMDKEGYDSWNLEMFTNVYDGLILPIYNRDFREMADKVKFILGTFFE